MSAPLSPVPTATEAGMLDGRLALDRCDELATISALPGRIDRFYLTPEHARGNALVAQWMSAAGMTVWQDEVGNQCGRYEGTEPGLPSLLLGSHLDTVPDAGRYDGPLGVMIAIAVVQRLHDRGVRLPFAVDVLGFSDEEGTRFGTALMGSRGAAGTWDPAWWNLVDDNGTDLATAFREFGLDPAEVARAGRRSEDVIAYLEAHIEQGPYLEDAGQPLGVVSSIAGARRFNLAILGEARHAGGTPYARRRDAAIGASHAVLEIEKLARAAGCIATVGRLQAYPGGVNVIPGRVEFSLDLRAEYDADRDLVWEKIHDAILARCARLGLRFVVEENHSAPAVWCADDLRAAVQHGIKSVGGVEPMQMFSRAGHDAMAIAAITGIGMLFIRCEDGISHHASEAVMLDDVAVAIDAFEATVLEVARRYA
ncbi:allantoate amidohydrolase [Nakamurella sp. YIM 132087]|uniref:Allantoate amidohydrolase n=1 Tax=Nakamurella alba TaxID=2665158 RepID=A0A7K1FJJ3_9ACTN|nr:allantoate amidohydrolase [Nakamurella alba]MTD14307.1 allantoate amidohydrolase [Nakamurella alba]